MERKEKTTAARFNRGRVGAMAPGSSSMTVADFMGIGLPGNGGANFGSAAARSSCCNVLSLLYSLRQHRRLLVTSQAHLRHYDEIGSRHLPREWVRQGRPLGGSRQQRGMGWLREAHRSACEPTVACHVPQALGPLSTPFERPSSPQTGAVAHSAAPRRGKTRRRRLPEPKRNLEAEPGIERTGLAEANTEPKWVPHRDGSGAERLGLGASTDCGFIWRNAGKPRSGTHQNLRQFGLTVGFPRSNQGQDQALVQRPHLRQPRARPPCPGRTKAKKPDEEISSVVRPAAESADRKSGTFPSDKRQKLIARLLIVTKRAEHGAGDGLAMLLFHAAHLHTQMAGFDNHANTLRSDFFLDGLGNLTGHALLNLQTARKHVNHACDLAESQHTLLRQIGDMGFAEEGQEVVFAEAEEFDVFNDDHLVVGHAERRAVQYMIDVQVVTAGQIFERFLETLRRLAQPFAIGILSDDLDNFAHVAGDAARV